METINVLKKNFDEAQHAYDAVKYRANRTHKAQKDSAKTARDLAHSVYQKALDDYTLTSNGNKPEPVQAVPPSDHVTKNLVDTSQSITEPALNVAPKLLEHEDGGLNEHIKPTSEALDPTTDDISITSDTKLREQENAPDREYTTDIKADKSSNTTATIEGFDDKAIDVEKPSAGTACIPGSPAAPDEVATNNATLPNLNESIEMRSNGRTTNLAQDIAKPYQSEHHRVDFSERRTYDQSLSEDKLRKIVDMNEGKQVPERSSADGQQFDKRNSPIMNVGNPGTEVIEHQTSQQSGESTVYNIVSSVLFNESDVLPNTSSSGGTKEAVTPSSALQLPVPVPQGCSRNIMPHVSDEMSTGDTARFTNPHALLDPLANSFDVHHSSVPHQVQTTGNDFSGIDNYGTSFGFEMEMLQEPGSGLVPFGVDQVFSFNRENPQHGTMGTTLDMFAPEAIQDQSEPPAGLPYGTQARYPIQSSNYLATLISDMSTSIVDNPKLAMAQHRIHALKGDISNLQSSIVNQQDEWEKLECSFRNGSQEMDLGEFVSRMSSLQANIKTANVDVELKSFDLKIAEQNFNQLLEYEKNVELKSAITSRLSDIQSKLNGPELPYKLYMELCRQRKEFEFHLADINDKVLQSTPEGQNNNPSGNGSSKKRKCSEDAEKDIEIDPDNADVVIDDERTSRKKPKTSQKRKIPKKEPKDDDDDMELDGDGNDDVQSGRMRPKRIKELAGKVKAKERELAKPRKGKKEEGSSKVVEQHQVIATHEEESPILGLSAKEFEEITEEGRAQLTDFLRTGDLDKLNPSIRRLARRYQGFLPESSFQNEHLAFSMHYTAQDSYVCRFHAENRAHKEHDGSGDHLIEGVGFKPDLQAKERPKGHMSCGCSIDDVLLEFYFWKVLKIRSSNPNMAGVEEGMKDLMLSTRARAFFCASFRNYSRLTFDDLCNAAKSGASHMTQLAKIQIERLVAEVRGSGQ